MINTQQIQFYMVICASIILVIIFFNAYCNIKEIRNQIEKNAKFLTMLKDANEESRTLRLKTFENKER